MMVPWAMSPSRICDFHECRNDKSVNKQLTSDTVLNISDLTNFSPHCARLHSVPSRGTGDIQDPRLEHNKHLYARGVSSGAPR